MQQQNATPTLGEFVDLRELATQADVRTAFPTEQSLRWFVRHHRDELVNAGALISLANRLRFHPAAFQRVAIGIGSRNVLTRAGRP